MARSQPPATRTPRTTRRFASLLRTMVGRHRLLVFELLLCCIITVAFAVGLQIVQQVLIDEAFPGPGRPGDSEVLFTVMAGLGVVLVIASLAGLRQTYVTAYLSGRMSRDLRLHAFRNLQYLRYGRFEQLPHGDVTTRMTADLGIIERALGTLLGGGLELTLTLVAAMVAVFSLDWRLGVAAILLLPLFVPTGLIMGPPTARASLQRQTDLGAMATDLQENLDGQFVVRTFSLERHSLSNFTRAADRLLRSSIRLTFLSSIYGLSTSSLGSLVHMLTLGIGGWMVIDGQLSLGTLVAFLGLLGLMIAPVQSIAGLVQVMQQATGALQRVDELLALPDGRADGTQPLGSVQWDLEFDDVSFGYGPRAMVLDSVSFRIQAGSRFAIVGPSGSGKSTLVRLMLRLEEPLGGAYRIDGIDSREISRDSLLQQVAVVPQDDFLFSSLTIAENIRLGKPDASDEELRAAISAASLDGVIAQLPDGLETQPGDRGGQLSGGQRQRVALARALLRQPSVLILDEATSALDTRTEAAIHDAIARLDRSVTVVTVTHRLVSVRDADWIVVLDDGRVVEQGTHGTLRAAGGLYERLWQGQRGEQGVAEPLQLSDRQLGT